MSLSTLRKTLNLPLHRGTAVSVNVGGLPKRGVITRATKDGQLKVRLEGERISSRVFGPSEVTIIGNTGGNTLV